MIFLARNRISILSILFIRIETVSYTHLIVATESGILHEMRKKCPEKNFIPAPPEDSTYACNECNFMRLNKLEKLYNTLKYEWPEVTVDEAVAEEAVKPVSCTHLKILVSNPI